VSARAYYLLHPDSEAAVSIERYQAALRQRQQKVFKDLHELLEKEDPEEEFFRRDAYARSGKNTLTVQGLILKDPARCPSGWSSRKGGYATPAGKDADARKRRSMLKAAGNTLALPDCRYCTQAFDLALWTKEGRILFVDGYALHQGTVLVWPYDEFKADGPELPEDVQTCVKERISPKQFSDMIDQHNQEVKK
jgi:hypothetical protein